MDALGTEVWVRRGVRPDALAQPLELALADVGQALTLGTRRRAGVEEDGDGELPPYALGELARELHAVVHGDAAHRHERHDVGRAHPGMLTAMRGEVDARGRHLHGAERGLDGRVRRRHQREHGAVVRGVGLGVEQPDARHPGDRLAQSIEDGLVTTV